jgi:hypothetical protein
MTLDEYEKMLEEKRATLNKPAAKVAKADLKDFEGMKAYTRKVCASCLPLICSYAVRSELLMRALSLGGEPQVLFP